MMRLPYTRVLGISAHPDDMELCFGGTIHRLIEDKAVMWLLILSHCQESLPDEYEAKDPLANESVAAVRALGMDYGHILERLFEVRRFDTHRQEILDTFISVCKLLRPDLVLVPGGKHQDHEVVRAEAYRAFPNKTLWAGEMPGDSHFCESPSIIRLSNEDIEAKVKALSCYVSQSNRRYMDGEHIDRLAMVRGVQIGQQYGEAYRIIRNGA